MAVGAHGPTIRNISVAYPGSAVPALAFTIMDWREYIASLLDSLAWPVAVVVLAWLIRERPAELLGGPRYGA